MSIVLLALASATAPNTEASRNWGQTLRTDATAMHDAIATSHPGAVNPDDPDLSERNNRQWRLALRRAKRAQTFEDYFYAIQGYAASFDDAHLGYGVFGNTPDEIRKWPGFLTRFDERNRQHVFKSEDWSGVPVGATLVSCDGRSADEIARERVGARFGRWNLAAQRLLWGGMVFLDTGNPYVKNIDRCRFEDKGKNLDVRLSWRPPGQLTYRDAVPAFRRTAKKVEWRRVADGIHWFGLPSFDGNPDGQTGTALRKLLTEMEDSAKELKSGRAIVFDLRGNGGGSSDWSYQIALKLWGADTMARHPAPPMTVTWRASRENLAAIEDGFATRSSKGNMTNETKRWYEHTIAGLRAAIERGDATWVIKPTVAANNAIERPPSSNSALGPVFILTDGFCMSACLDAVDLWKRLGAIPIGQETGADTLYMETRRVRMPSGLGAISLPMKVYSGRPRGMNEPVVPVHKYQGDISDTSAVEQWIASILNQQPRPLD